MTQTGYMAFISVVSLVLGVAMADKFKILGDGKRWPVNLIAFGLGVLWFGFFLLAGRMVGYL